MNTDEIAHMSGALLEAEARLRPRGRLTAEWNELDVESAYRVQAEGIRTKLEQGDGIVGTKLGLTSRAKQVRMGISSPLTGTLLRSHILPADSPVPLARLIHPRVEPEIVFVLGRDLRGPNVTSALALGAVERVYAGLEIIDSRFNDYDFGLADVVADNASSAFFCLGPISASTNRLDLLHEAVVLSINGSVVATATGAAVQGHPAEALALAANELAARGRFLAAGDLILTGGMTDAIPLRLGDHVSAEFSTLGSVFVRG